MRLSSIVCGGIVAACAVGAASAQASVDGRAAGSLPLVGWSAVLMILIGTGVTVFRMLQGSPPGRPKRRVSGKALRAR